MAGEPPRVPFTPSHFLSLGPPSPARPTPSRARSQHPRKRPTKAGSTAGLKALSTLIAAEADQDGNGQTWLEKTERELKEWAAHTARFAKRASGWSEASLDQAAEAAGVREGSSDGRSFTRVPPGDPLDLPTPPPSPSLVPGAWPFTAPSRGQDSASLSLPPPFLDELSSKESFEGLLGIRRQKEASLRRRRIERQLALDRPPNPPFPKSILTTAGKLVGALGPPGGLYSHASGDTKEGRRRREGERALKGFEVGDKFVGEVARRLRRTTSTKAPGPTDAPLHDATPLAPTHRILTPASILATDEPSSSSSSSSANTPLPPTSPGSWPAASSSRTSVPIFRPPAPRLGPITNVEPTTSLLQLNSSAIFSPLSLDTFPTDMASVVSEADVTSPTSTAQHHVESSDDDYFKPKLRYRRRKGMQSSSSCATTTVATPAPAVPTAEVIVNAAATEGQHRLDMLILFLVGPSQGGDDSLCKVGGLLGALLFVIGFAFFVAVHLASLMWSACRALKAAGLFGYWIAINLAGRTDFSQVARGYYRLCRKKWDEVAREDGESLGVWSVCIGLAELAAVQAITRQKYLSDSAALDLIDTTFGPLPTMDSVAEEEVGTSPALTPYLPNFTRGKSERRRGADPWSGEGEQLIVTGRGDTVVEGTVFTPSSEPPNPFSAPPPPPRTTMDEFETSPMSLDAAASHLDAEATLPSPPMTPLILGSPQRRRLSLALPPPAPAVVELPEMLRSLKRHARLATASYGLHSYILHPPTPVFTPSGASLPNSIFSHLSKIDDQSSVIHVAIQKDYVGAWGSNGEGAGQGEGKRKDKGEPEEDEWQPTVFVVRDHVNREIDVVFRGTQSLHDIVTDLQAEDEQLVLPRLSPDEDYDGGGATFKVHGGILRAVKRMFEPKAALYGKLGAALAEHEGYGLVFCGHSLGAACASTAAILLSEAVVGPKVKGGQLTWRIAGSTGLPKRSIRAVCFAPPTTVDVRLASRCATGTPWPLVTSVTLSSDVICRFGTGQIKELRRALGRLAKLRRGFLERRRSSDVRGGGKEGQESHGQTSVLRDWWRWRSLTSTTAPSTTTTTKDGVKKVDDQEQVRRIEGQAWRIRRQVAGGSNDEAMLPPGMAFHIDRVPDVDAIPKLGAVVEGSEEDADGPTYGFFHVRDPSAFFALPWLDSDLVSSHLPKCYLDAIESI